MRWSAIFVVLLTLGCGQDYDENIVDGLRVVSVTMKSKGNGQAKFKLPVEAGETSMLATIEVQEPYLAHFQYLDDPDRQNLFDWKTETGGQFSKTNAGYIAQVVNLNWPVGGVDEGLREGKYKFSLNVVEGTQYVSQPIDLTIALKSDDDLSGGTLRVAIVYAGGTDSEPATVAAVEAALDQWVDLYADIGVDVVFSTYAFADGTLDPPAFGTDDGFIEISEMTAFREVNVVIAPEIEALDDVYGIAGDIPGPLVATRRSGVLVSTLLSAGTDGEFNANEVRILAETLAHETGHYLGLFHPVEITFDTWDSLSDTPECDGEFSCVKEMEDHLMFPFPVCGLATCTPQNIVTDQQGQVVNRHVAID